MDIVQILLLIVAPLVIGAVGWWAKKWPPRVQRIALATGVGVFSLTFLVGLLVFFSRSGATP